MPSVCYNEPVLLWTALCEQKKEWLSESRSQDHPGAPGYLTRRRTYPPYRTLLFRTARPFSSAAHFDTHPSSSSASVLASASGRVGAAHNQGGCIRLEHRTHFFGLLFSGLLFFGRPALPCRFFPKPGLCRLAGAGSDPDRAGLDGVAGRAEDAVFRRGRRGAGPGRAAPFSGSACCDRIQS